MPERSNRMAHRRHGLAVQLRHRRLSRERLRVIGHNGEVQVRIHVDTLGANRFEVCKRNAQSGVRMTGHMRIGQDPAALRIHHEPGAIVRADLVLDERSTDRAADLDRPFPRSRKGLLSGALREREMRNRAAYEESAVARRATGCVRASCRESLTKLYGTNEAILFAAHGDLNAM